MQYDHWNRGGDGNGRAMGSTVRKRRQLMDARNEIGCSIRRAREGDHEGWSMGEKKE